ncbi:MAG: HDIG domain-containing metalloprotein [Planctomycetota bacterium]
MPDGKKPSKTPTHFSGSLEAVRPRKVAVEQRRDMVRRLRKEDMTGVREWLTRDSTWVSVCIGLVFAMLLGLMLQLRPDVVPYRLGQTVRHDVVARVPFEFYDQAKHQQERVVEMEATPRVFNRVELDPFDDLEQWLTDLPDQLVGKDLGDLDPALREVLDNATMVRLQAIAGVQPRTYNKEVYEYVSRLRTRNPVILRPEEILGDSRNDIRAEGVDRLDLSYVYPLGSDKLQELLIKTGEQEFAPELYGKIALLSLARISATHELDEDATSRAREVAGDLVAAVRGNLGFAARDTVVPAGKKIDLRDLALLRTEARAYRGSLGADAVYAKLGGLAGMTLLLTAFLGVYTMVYQPRIIQNHVRAIGLAGLFIGTVLVAQLAATGTSPLYLFAVAPTLLVAMILSIAYDRRYALGASIVHAAFVTLATSQGIGLLLIIAAGVVTVVVLLDEVRNRSKLIEVGGASAVVMMLTATAVGLTELDPYSFILRNALYAGAAGLGVGFVVLGILPFIEKAFRITTSMTLLELADVNSELLRQLQLRAPGSYNHSMQVAILAEEAARAVGADALLCRVAGYYHDIGKINKSEYFIENQSGGESRHLNLSPSVSILVIIGHVKDGVELARQHHLPRSIVPFITEHHGTTLVEYFYRNAMEKSEASDETVAESQYRYQGPKPRSRETAIMMLADTCESAVRAMKEHTPNKIEQRVGDLAMKRLLDGQFDDSGLTMRDLDAVKRSLVKSLVSIYHGRIEYPSDKEEPVVPVQTTGPTIAAAG